MRKPRSGEWFPSFSPSTEEKLAEVAQANEKDVDLAVKAARAAYTVLRHHRGNDGA